MHFFGMKSNFCHLSLEDYAKRWYLRSELSHLSLLFLMEKCSQHQLLDWLMFSFPLECFSLHWSLVIICIPDKEDESGLTIIHLDSLGLHPRNLIFNNVKRFLREEWNYLNQDAPLDLPISAKVWRDLPNMINEAEVQASLYTLSCKS
jgi:alpha-amylase/alpha-mannosidase (GH57 family)